MAGKSKLYLSHGGAVENNDITQNLVMITPIMNSCIHFISRIHIEDTHISRIHQDGVAPGGDVPTLNMKEIRTNYRDLDLRSNIFEYSYSYK